VQSILYMVESDARVRLIAVLLLIVAALVFVSIPFHEQGESKGPRGLPSLACRAPIIGGWAGAQPSLGPLSGTYDGVRYTCGGAERTRLVGAGVVIGVGAGLLVIMLVIPRRRAARLRT
jgi:hypothetical protein